MLRAQEAGKIVLKGGGAQVATALSDTDEKDTVRNHPAKVYSINLRAGQEYQIDMTSKKLDSYLRLEDAAGKELAQDDDGGDGLNARISFKAPASGTYRIICTTFNGGIGPFRLAVRHLRGGATPPEEVTGAELALNNGAALVNSRIALGDPKDTAQNRPSKVFLVKLVRGKTYQIDMRSTKLDSFLRLEGPGGKELAKDDDSGGQLNARIVFECRRDGIYQIICTTFIGSNDGLFQLRVKEQ